MVPFATRHAAGPTNGIAFDQGGEDANAILKRQAVHTQSIAFYA